MRRSTETAWKGQDRQQLIRRGLAPFLLWTEFWAEADEVRGHYLWRGETDAQGEPVHLLGNLKPALPARRLAWSFRQEPLPPGVVPRNKCGHPLCIRPSHQSVRGGRP